MSGVALDLKTMLTYKDRTVSQLTKGIEYLFKKNKVEYISGSGKIVGANEVQVTDSAGANKIVKAKNILIATGSEPMGFPGLTVSRTYIYI